MGVEKNEIGMVIGISINLDSIDQWKTDNCR